MADLLPSYDDDDMDRAVVHGMELVAREGITTFLDANADRAYTAAYSRAAEARRLTARVALSLSWLRAKR